MRRTLRITGAVGITLTLMASACSDGEPGSSDLEPTDSPADTFEESTQEPAVTVQVAGGQVLDDPDTIIELELSPAEGSPHPVEPSLPEASGSPLDEERHSELLSRLEPLPASPDDAVSFRRPVQTRPPPTSRVEQAVPFPPQTAAPAVPEPDAGPLNVLRVQPQGAIETAPFISITFDQPMVSVGTIDDVEAEDVPVIVTPAIEGRWSWIGTKTLRFDHDGASLDRLPKATTFSVQIPRGTTSTAGHRLDETVEFEFTTPTTRVVNVTPLHQTLATDQLFLVEFNQRVAADRALEGLRLNVGGQAVALALASDEEIAGNDEISDIASRILPDRAVVVRPTSEMAKDSRVEIVAGPGIASAEGSAVGNEVQRFEGHTWGDFALVSHGCDSPDRCQPGHWFWLEFTNPIDTSSFSPEMVKVEPSLPRMSVSLEWNRIRLTGPTRGQTTYTVTVDPTVKDTFGQSLADGERVEFDVGDADPNLMSPYRELLTLDPFTDTSSLTFGHINHDEFHVRIYEVDPDSDWLTYLDNEWGLRDRTFSPSWPLIAEKRLKTNTERNDFGETHIDLREQLVDSDHLVVVVSPTHLSANEWENYAVPVWVQNTSLGIDAHSDGDRTVTWVTDLRTGDPVADAQVSSGHGTSTTTDADGLAWFDTTLRSQTLLARHGEDVALIGRYWSEPIPLQDRILWYSVTDRGLYKPGETVRIKGWARQARGELPAELALLKDATVIDWTARDALGNDYATGSAELSDLGGFDFNVPIPEDVTLGSSHVLIDARYSGAYGEGFVSFDVQQFRRPDFEVITSVESPDPYVRGEAINLATEARYFTGEPLTSSAVEWTAQASVGTYAPPGWDRFHFGLERPLWLPVHTFGPENYAVTPIGFDSPAMVRTISGLTDDQGRNVMEAQLDTHGKPQPISLVTSATVLDVNRQPVTSQIPLLVHPSSLYVGVRSATNFVEAGEDISVEAVVVDVDGAARSDIDIRLSLSLITSIYDQGRWSEQTEEVSTCTMVSAIEPVDCLLETDVGGRYRLSAVVVDEEERDSLTESLRWVSGSDSVSARAVDLEEITLVPNAEGFTPGETAQILVQAPFPNAQGLYLTTRQRFASATSFDFDSSGSAVLEIPITESDVGELLLQVEAVGTAARGDDSRRPAYASGILSLPVSAERRRLDIRASLSPSTVEPGGDSELHVEVADASGEPVADAELAVIVVDEAVLSLIGYSHGDPLDSFYIAGSPWINSYRSRDSLVISSESPGSVAAISGGIGDGTDLGLQSAAVSIEADFAAEAMVDEKSSGTRSPAATAGATDTDLSARSIFDALALFEPEIRTDNSGRAALTVDLPDNLTRYRVVVLATAGASQAGSTEAELTAKLPISVRPSPPRFANYGDRFEFPVVVHNGTDTTMNIEVALRATNLLIEGVGKTVEVPAHDRVEVRFDASTVEAGTARYQVVAVSGAEADAAEGSFPVYSPVTTEAFATYGTLDEGALSHQIAVPTDVIENFGGLDVSTSSTAVSALADAVIYLDEYRFEHADAFASRILAISALKEILVAFATSDAPSADALTMRVSDDIDRLLALQNSDGGFHFWRRGQQSVPFVTVHAAHALVVASANGHRVPADPLARLMAYVASIENHIPSHYDQRSRRSLTAYALYVRHLAGDPDRQKAISLLGEATDLAGDDLPVDTVAWLWSVLGSDASIDREIETLLSNRVTESASSATFVTSFDEQDHLVLRSQRQTDAIVLLALLEHRPDSDLVIKTLSGLLAARGPRGHWPNITDNAFVLLAASRYFEQFERADPSFVAHAWLDETYALEQSFDQRSTSLVSARIPMQFLTDSRLVNESKPEDKAGAERELIIAKEGEGRLYYRVGLDYAPEDLTADPRDRGFVVTRSYEPIDSDDDVIQTDDGGWQVNAGARLRVKVTMVADSQRSHVALVDPIPAGFEILNPALAATEPLIDDDDDHPQDSLPRWYGAWLNHQALRDDRAEAFSSWLGGGTYQYEYFVRATTPGRFVVPPAKAEQIYEPENFGRSSSDVVVVVG